ncbi:MAG: flippase-like domain-containing protein [Thermodesulfovibrio sp.]|nr:flippase-like domain-containing protein [Thermodesulfovibrio sp.]
MKKNIKLILRFFITLSLISYLSIKIDFYKLWNILSEVNIFLFLLSSLLYVVSSYISTLRWNLFIPSNADITLNRLFSLYMIGCFFNIFLPGIIGGDVIKIILMRKKTGFKEAIGSVFIERYMGFFALLMLGVLFFVIFYKKMPENWTIYLVPSVFIVFLLGTILLYFLGRFSILRDLREYFFKISRKLFLQAFFYSLFVQILVMISVYIIFWSLNVSINFYEIVIYLPIIIILATLPISISGVGVREWGFIAFFGSSIGFEKALAVSLLWFFSVALASLSGGLEYLRFKDFIDMHYKK